MMRTSRQLRNLLLCAGDIALLYFSLWLTLKFRYSGSPDSQLWGEHVGAFTIVFAAWLIIFAVGGLYDVGSSGGRIQLASRIAGALAIAGIVAATYFYLGYNRLFTLRPQKVLAIVLVIAFFGMLLWRILFLAALRSPRLSRRVLLVGSHQIIPELITELNSKPQLGFFPVAWLQVNGSESPQLFDTSKFRDLELSIYHELTQMREICQRHQVDLIVSGISPRHHENLLRELLSCLPLHVDFSDLSKFYERVTGKVPVDAIEHVWFLENLQEGTKRPYELIKRMMDIVLAVALLILAIPLLPFLYALVKLSSPGAFLFTQVRVGQAGRKFRAMKIRTMVVDAEKHGPQWARPDDARVTPVGKIMRKIRVDEIPQLYNILRGEMSLIGPRPERPEFIEELKRSIPFYEERLLVKPGLTGWAQVNFPYGASVEDTLEKLQYDLFYIKNRTLGLDLSIGLRTIGTILSRSGR